LSTITNTSLYTYTYSAEDPILKTTVLGGKLNDESVFRVGSVSKLVTVYAILAFKGDLKVFDDPITKYIHELGGSWG
jgi:hypothetical protein